MGSTTRALSALNSRLVYCSITGFGQTGPYASRAGYDFLIQGLGGLMSVTGRRDSEPGGGPLKVGVALTDILTGVYASSAILAALAYRERSGVGQHIDLALLDVQVACLANQALSYLTTGGVPQTDRRSTAPNPELEAVAGEGERAGAVAVARIGLAASAGCRRRPSSVPPPLEPVAPPLAIWSNTSVS